MRRHVLPGIAMRTWTRAPSQLSDVSKIQVDAGLVHSSSTILPLQQTFTGSHVHNSANACFPQFGSDQG